MALLKFPHTTPPDGFIYTQPETGTRIEGDTLAECIERVVAHREWKGLERADKGLASQDIQRQICMGMPKGVCQAEPGEDYQPFKDNSRDFTAASVMAASETLIRHVINGGELVSVEESERRASICRGCRFNRNSPSWVCAKICATLDKLVPKGREQPGLQICGICSCSTKLKTLIPLAVLLPANERRGLIFPSYCWQAPNPSGEKEKTDPEITS